MNTTLAKHIIDRAERDQALRVKYREKHHDKDWRDQIDKLDDTNTAFMRHTVERFGWPTISLVGKKASHAAWLLVQHADHDVEFQEYCLDLMKKSGDVLPTNIAYLTDRTLVARSKKQIYGTQFIKDKNHPDKWIPSPIKNVAEADRLRAEIGMQSLQENIDEINQNKPYGVKASSL